MADAAGSVENAVLRKERARLLGNLIRGLPDRERELMLRKYFYLQSSKTIATAMGMTVNAVDTKLSRLRGKMRAAFCEAEGT